MTQEMTVCGRPPSTGFAGPAAIFLSAAVWRQNRSRSVCATSAFGSRALGRAPRRGGGVDAVADAATRASRALARRASAPPRRGRRPARPPLVDVHRRARVGRARRRSHPPRRRPPPPGRDVPGSSARSGTPSPPRRAPRRRRMARSPTRVARRPSRSRSFPSRRVLDPRRRATPRRRHLPTPLARLATSSARPSADASTARRVPRRRDGPRRVPADAAVLAVCPSRGAIPPGLVGRTVRRRTGRRRRAVTTTSTLSRATQTRKSLAGTAACALLGALVAVDVPCDGALPPKVNAARVRRRRGSRFFAFTARRRPRRPPLPAPDAAAHAHRWRSRASVAPSRCTWPP